MPLVSCCNRHLCNTHSGTFRRQRITIHRCARGVHPSASCPYTRVEGARGRARVCMCARACVCTRAPAAAVCMYVGGGGPVVGSRAAWPLPPRKPPHQPPGQ
eukprot:gene20585-biopygen5594